MTADILNINIYKNICQAGRFVPVVAVQTTRDFY